MKKLIKRENLDYFTVDNHCSECGEYESECECEASPTSYKVGVKTSSDTDWAYNGLRFPTREAAEAYGADLAWRWMAVTAWEVHESDDEPNQGE